METESREVYYDILIIYFFGGTLPRWWHYKRFIYDASPFDPLIRLYGYALSLWWHYKLAYASLTLRLRKFQFAKFVLVAFYYGPPSLM